MMGAGGVVFGKQGIYEESITPLYPLGTRMDIGDRTFFYSSADETLYAGNTCEAADLGGATTTLQSSNAITVAAAIGDTRIYVCAGTTAQDADTFADGWATIWDGTTVGTCYCFKVKGNSALATSGTTSYIDLYDGVPIAFDTSDQVSLIANLYKKVHQGNTTQAGALLGVAPINVTSGYYFWLQTYGPAAVYPGVAAFVIDEYVGLSDTTAGAAETVTGIDSGAAENPVLGYTLHTGTLSEAGIVFLTVRR
jgi:hypothetical protein